MKKAFTSLGLSNSRKKYLKFIAVITLFVLFFLLSKFLFERMNLEENIGVDVKIVKLKESGNSCTFNFVIRPSCEGKINLRILIIHSGWVAIYDKTRSIECKEFSEIVEIPKRDYVYTVRIAAFSEGKFGKVVTNLRC